MKRAIVLSGGGAKGAYQIGVWKALKKLHIKYDIITGTSVGALNGVFMVQNSYFKAKKLWKKMDFKLIFAEADLKKFNNVKDSKDLLLMFGTNLIKQGGMRVDNLENLVDINFNARKFFKSKKDFGIITFNATKLKPTILKKGDLTKGNLRNYVIASASCFPFFKMKEIDHCKYMDGGFYDNMPINLAIELGADEIIAVDLKAPGIIREIPKKYHRKVTYIKPHNDIGMFLNFDSKQSQKNIKFGYNDTLKVFKKLDGIHYTFKKGHVDKLNKKYQDKFINMIERTIKNNYSDNIIDKILTDLIEKRLFGIIEKDIDKLFLESLEYVAKCLHVEETKVYRYKKFNKSVRKNFNNYYQVKDKISITELIKNEYKDFDNARRVIIKFYELLEKDKLDDIDLLAITYPKELMGAIYLYIIK